MKIVKTISFPYKVRWKILSYVLICIFFPLWDILLENIARIKGISRIVTWIIFQADIYIYIYNCPEKLPFHSLPMLERLQNPTDMKNVEKLISIPDYRRKGAHLERTHSSEIFARFHWFSVHLYFMGELNHPGVRNLQVLFQEHVKSRQKTMKESSPIKSQASAHRILHFKF